MSNHWNEPPGPGEIPDAAGWDQDGGGRAAAWTGPADRGTAAPPAWDGYGYMPGPGFAEDAGPGDAGPEETWQEETWQEQDWPEPGWGPGTGPRRSSRRPGPGRRRRPGLAMTAGAALLIAALAASAVITLRLHGHPAAQIRPVTTSQPGQRASSPAPASPPAAQAAVTGAAARQILAGYLSRNNTANQSRSTSLLAGIEGGSSFLMDAGAYRWTRVTDESNSRYTPLTFASPQFFIPAATSYPQWFAVRGTWVKAGGSPEGEAYLVFARNAAGAPWLEVLEPNIITGGPDIQVAAGPGGNAIAASGTDSTQRDIAAYLDTGSGNVTGFTAPGDLQDLTDQAFWRAKMPAGSADTDRHSLTGDPVFGLRTSSGGVLEFFDLSATLNLTLPAGDTAGFEIPGYYSASKPVSAASVPYADQFAVYVPPGGTGRLQVVADAGGVASQH